MLALALSGTADASSPAAWRALDAKVAKACVGASGLARARMLADKVSFSDALPVELRVVQGFDRRGRYARRLCAYDRRTGRVELQEATTQLGGATAR